MGGVPAKAAGAISLLAAHRRQLCMQRCSQQSSLSAAREEYFLDRQSHIPSFESGTHISNSGDMSDVETAIFRRKPPGSASMLSGLSASMNEQFFIRIIRITKAANKKPYCITGVIRTIAVDHLISI